METFALFRHKSNGVVASYPQHYETHPVFGDDLERYDPDIYEEDKVDLEDHNLPVDQRGQVVAKKLEDFTVAELQDIARERGLATGGTKAELIERIQDADARTVEDN